MNHIENIEIKNFKSIKHATINDCRRVNVFIGYPNVGKSNILEGLGLYSINKQNNNLSHFVRYEGVSTLFHNSNIEAEFEITVNGHHKVIGYFSKQKLSIKRLYAKELFPTQILGELERLVQNGIDERWGLDIENNKSSFYSNDFNEGLLGQLLSEIKKYNFSKNPQSKEEYSFLSVPFGENLFFILSTNPAIRKEVAELFKPYNLRLNLDKTNNTIRIAKDLEDDTFFTIPFSMIADTLQRLIFHKTAISSNKESILLFEEPEANMFEPFIMELTNNIKEDTQGNQFFIVTHSQYVIDELLRDTESRNDTNIYLVGSENGETRVKLLDRDKNEDVFLRGLNVFFNYQSLWEEN